MISSDTPIAELTGVGKTTANRFKKLGIQTAGDLLWHLPRRHEDFSKRKDIAELKVGEIATVAGKVELLQNRRARHRRMSITECLLTDETGSIKIIWFNQPYLQKQLPVGSEIYVSGKVDDDYHTLQFTNPVWEKNDWQNEKIHTGRIIPIYPTTAGITQKQIRWLQKQIMPLIKQVEDFLPSSIITHFGLTDLRSALQNIHWPGSEVSYEQSIKRLQFDELFLLQLVQEKNREQLNQLHAPVVPFQEDRTREMVGGLPFKLTDDQRRAAWGILQDIALDRPMNRLLQGDVGSGKTVVAAIAALNCALGNYQSILLAPTELLANQHFMTFQRTLKDFKLNLCLYTRAQHKLDDKDVTKQQLTTDIRTGSAQIIIGTHALLQEHVSFHDVGLIVIDEQHRFGVKQRQKLKTTNPATTPHFLSMTATPIPRTLALTLYGDLDISLLRTKPPGRKKVITKIVTEANRRSTYYFITKQINAGRQAFVICPLIEESDKIGVKAATQEYKKLSQHIFPQLRIGLLHGRLKSEEKKSVMDGFVTGKLDILVATSVIEVGIDVPNATIMVIEGAERFGLAQLHQFRGRVGRSDHQSYCLLFTDANDRKSQQRLHAMADYDDGLKLAEYDLSSRGSGEIYGTKQSGLPDLKIADFTDLELITSAKKAARDIIKTSPDLKKFPRLLEEYQRLNSDIHWE